MITDSRNKLEDSYIKISDSKEIDELRRAYQLLLHNLRRLSTFHLEKVKTFLNDFYTPTRSLSELLGDPEILNDFIKDPCNIIRLKNLLTDLNDHSQSIGSGYGYLALKSEENE